WLLINFFLRAEDGIRDFHVTGVQTCALPISRCSRSVVDSVAETGPTAPDHAAFVQAPQRRFAAQSGSVDSPPRASTHARPPTARSEERRVGKALIQLSVTRPGQENGDACQQQ